jgi:Uma2 family endonuclease
LVVEVSDSTLSFDLRTKAALYARAQIVEYWVLDIAGRRLIVHRNPEAGRYTSVVAYGAEETASPLAAPESCLRIKDVLPE